MAVRRFDDQRSNHRGIGPRRSAWLAALALPFGAAALPAAAQPAMQQAPPTGRHVEIDLTGRVDYNSNITENRPLTAATHLVRKDDELYTPGIKLDASLPVASTNLFVVGTAQYQFHQYNTFLNREALSAVAGASRRIGRCLVTLEGQYDRRQSDLSDLALDVVKNVETQVGGSAQAVCITATGLSASLQADESHVRNSAELTPDYHIADVSGAFGYTNHVLGSASVTAGATRLRYDHVPARLQGFSTGYDMTTAGVRYERPFGARLDGRANLGYYSLDVQGAQTSKQTGFTGQVGFTYRVTPRISADLDYTRGIKPSSMPGASYARDEQSELHLHYAMTRRIQFHLAGQLIDRRYGQTVTLPISALLTTPTVERRRSVYGSVDVKIGVKTSLSLQARHDVRRTDIPALNYDADVVGILATVAF